MYHYCTHICVCCQKHLSCLTASVLVAGCCWSLRASDCHACRVTLHDPMASRRLQDVMETQSPYIKRPPPP
ncbi:hypothetical protein DFP73DRAFT_563152 [Morchella snyderi]|nr:hypothetical protein DFP73DRAFT_563152 [Morchella snyderi]